MFRELAQHHELTFSIKLISPLDKRALDSLYHCAIALVFPSSCEGFGFPVVEAAAQGCPTVAYTRTPAAEIIGDELPLANELSVDAFVPLMHVQATMSSTDRAAQAARLTARAQKFSCQRMARETLSVLTEAATG
jgi:glycosyltransferase involved in cell wall biosynthesis